MSADLRLFIAIPIPVTSAIEGVRQELRGHQSALRVGRDDPLHLTLKFIGATPPHQVPVIEAVLQETLAGQTAFPLELQGVGAFPKPTRPSVVWIGLADNPNLHSIAKDLEANLATIGIPRENRDYHPHVTIARVRRGRSINLAEFCQAQSQLAFGQTQIDTVVLYESNFQSGSKRNGPIYTPLVTVSLN
ncbi:RNA 2',3'-cyclic phosphodiesterase [Thalassoroseus pseudoceratinae]|uniref:RNA 2',3'-cyclic phosphodiesterase n=1 Tax=Thalassoroseus pseudoceratinae TaxID=2713176 RepID=UPI00141E2BD8|nr:RNA 2',3'-cyclic phosphodiesterase [Thalassoroseus pseudoceratinae]